MSTPDEEERATWPADAATDERYGAKDRAQRFFAELDAESRKPHYGHLAKDWTRSLLTRAQEQGLYTPEST